MMLFLRKLIYFIFFLAISIFVLFTGCKSKKIITKPEPTKVNSANQQGTAIDYDEAVKRHFDMQSDRTKMMMIKSDKMKVQKNYGKNRQWYDQLFNTSCFKNSDMVKTGHSHSTITSRQSCFIKE